MPQTTGQRLVLAVLLATFLIGSVVTGVLHDTWRTGNLEFTRCKLTGETVQKPMNPDHGRWQLGSFGGPRHARTLWGSGSVFVTD